MITAGIIILLIMCAVIFLFMKESPPETCCHYCGENSETESHTQCDSCGKTVCCECSTCLSDELQEEKQEEDIYPDIVCPTCLMKMEGCDHV